MPIAALATGIENTGNEVTGAGRRCPDKRPPVCRDWRSVRTVFITWHLLRRRRFGFD